MLLLLIDVLINSTQMQMQTLDAPVLCIHAVHTLQGWRKQFLFGQTKYIMARKARREILRFDDIHDHDVINSACARILCMCGASLVLDCSLVPSPLLAFCVRGGWARDYTGLHVQRTHLQLIVDHGSLVVFVISA